MEPPSCAARYLSGNSLIAPAGLSQHFVFRVLIFSLWFCCGYFYYCSSVSVIGSFSFHVYAVINIFLTLLPLLGILTLLAVPVPQLPIITICVFPIFDYYPIINSCEILSFPPQFYHHV